MLDYPVTSYETDANQLFHFIVAEKKVGRPRKNNLSGLINGDRKIKAFEQTGNAKYFRRLPTLPSIPSIAHNVKM